MARYTGPACKLCRREGKKLYLKGDRCVSGKCALERRTSAPGQHGADAKKMREYGMQLREKQTTKRYYGVLEKQFRNLYEEAARKEGMTGENLLVLLERRLDNVVYRMGMAECRRDARQLVLHGHFTVNGKKVNVPSFVVKPGDVIAVKESAVIPLSSRVWPSPRVAFALPSGSSLTRRTSPLRSWLCPLARTSTSSSTSS